MSKRQNIFVSFLELLKVRHIQEFSNRYFNEHPHKYNLFGLSKMLSEYGIENAAVKIADKGKDIFDIQIPFIAPFGGDFAAVQKVEQDKVSLRLRHMGSKNQRFIDVRKSMEKGRVVLWKDRRG